MKTKPQYLLFDRETQAIFYGQQQEAIQRMLDFDYVCERETPSVAAVVNPTSEGYLHAFFGTQEILIPIYRSVAEAAAKHPDADVMVNFASFRSAYSSTKEALLTDSIKTIIIIAEGIPEREARELVAISKEKKKWLIGPSTVGGIAPGVFRIGNSGGSMENIIASKLYRSGSVAFVSKSGGLSNELSYIISKNSNGVAEGIALGGDRFPGSTFLDHLLRFDANPEIRLMVMLGEIGGVDEYAVVEALKTKKLTKPLIAWCIGTSAKVFPGEVQFGHAGARADGDKESSQAKNIALREAGALVPESFATFDDLIAKTYSKLVKDGVIMEKEEIEPKSLPLDYAEAVKKGLVRKATNFASTISDERREELLYAGIPISEVSKTMGIGDVIGLLWLKKKLPKWAAAFLEKVLILTADHGPAVSGAHNSIVAARAGKDIISSLVSGLLTIGPRFGGAINGGAEKFFSYSEAGQTPYFMVADLKEQGILIPGIGHKIKSLKNPDKRVELLKNFAKQDFPATKYLDYALEVEKITTAKKENLILNVDGTIGVLFCDMLTGLGYSKDEIKEFIELNVLDGLFALGRSIGLIGHIIDQKRLKTDLYRHPTDDIAYIPSVLE